MATDSRRAAPGAPDAKPAPGAAPEAASEAAPGTAPDAHANPWAELTEMQAAAAETLTRNLAEALAHTQKLMVNQSLEAAKSPPEATLDPFHIAPDAAKVWGAFATDPGRFAAAQTDLWQRYMSIWQTTAKRLAGETAPDAVPGDKTDKRWKGEDWEKNTYFNLLKQSYLATSNWMLETVSAADGVDDQTKRKVAFFTKQMADAFAPTNFALTNPAVLRATLQTAGRNLVEGLHNFADDLERGHGRLAIRQTDYAKFEVGRDVATAPGQVVYQNDLFQLVQYSPTTETVKATPLLIFPPWINKFYILDLRPENSMVRYLVDQGHTVFLTSWVNPTAALAGVTFEDYMRRGIFEALDVVLKQTGQPKANTVGYCIGGTLLATALAYMGQTGDERIASATFFAAQTDFSEAGDLLLFIDDDWLAEIEKRMDAGGGVLDGRTMADTFNMLRANDLIWSFYVNNYLMGETPKAFDLLFWNSDQTNLPKTMHLYYLDKFYRHNALSQGELVIGGRKLKLEDIKTRAYVQSSREDHIAPFGSVFKGARKFGGDTRFVMAGSGHIAGVINHPEAKKYQHWVNDVSPLPQDVGAWVEGAAEHPGSWWPHWMAWLAETAGEDVPARHAETGPHRPIEPAPGAYVKTRY